MSERTNVQTGALAGVLDHALSRRSFVKVTGAAAGVAAATPVMLRSTPVGAANDPGTPDNLETSAGVAVRYSVCLGCHSKCGMAVRVKDDTVLKVDGNPWHPNNAETGERLPFDASTETGDLAPASLCPKGQAGVEVMYNPFRIQGPMKRVGARGSGNWESISWDQALTEIADKLKPYYQGYDAGTHINGYEALGTIANQVAFSPGRLQHGQKEFTDRVWKYGFGTINARHDHTSICETTHHVAGDFFTEKRKHHFKPDMLNSQYILWFGTNPLEANFPGQTLAKRMVISRNAGTKHVIIDPRHSRACAAAHRWLPVKVNGDAALAMGMARRIIEQGTYDLSFLEAANNEAGLATTDWDGQAKDKHYNNTDSAYLVVVAASDPDDEWLFLRDGGAYVVTDPASGARTTLDRDKAAAAQWGRVMLDGTEADAVMASSVGLEGVGEYVFDLGEGVYAAPAFQLYVARLMSHPMSFYSVESGIDAATIAAVADEFAAAGRAAVATVYRGGCQKTSGMATMQAILALNNLVGNWDWKGGSNGATADHLHEMGEKAAGQLAMKSTAPAKRSPGGPQLTRVKTFFDSALAEALGESMDGSTTRQWFPWAYNGAYQEIVPSIEDMYPYQCGALISYWNNLPWSTPAGKATSLRVLKDESILPLHVCFDIEMGEMAALADYVLPDGSYFERWSTPHNAPVVLSTYSCFRSPVVGYYAQKGFWEALAAGTLDTWSYEIDWQNDTGPFTLEDITIELMRRVGGGNLDTVGGLGTNAYYASHGDLMAAGVSATMRNELTNAWDWYWNILVNFAIEAGVDPDDPAALKDMAHKIVERGGWFADTTDDQGQSINEYDGDYVKSRMKVGNYAKALHFFFEYAYPSSHPDKPGKRYTDPFSLLRYDPLPDVEPIRDAKGNVVDDGEDFPFSVVTYKPMYHSQGRTDSLPSLTVLEPENFVEMNTSDARDVGVWNGDLVLMTSPSNSNGIKGRVRVTERIRPGVLAVSHSRGRWEINSRSWSLDGTSTGKDSRRGRGLNTNEVSRLDPSLGNVTLQEPIGASASFSDTRVRIQKILA